MGTAFFRRGDGVFAQGGGYWRSTWGQKSQGGGYFLCIFLVGVFLSWGCGLISVPDSLGNGLRMVVV